MHGRFYVIRGSSLSAMYAYVPQRLHYQMASVGKPKCSGLCTFIPISSMLITCVYYHRSVVQCPGYIELCLPWNHSLNPSLSHSTTVMRHSSPGLVYDDVFNHSQEWCMVNCAVCIAVTLFADGLLRYTYVCSWIVPFSALTPLFEWQACGGLYRTVPIVPKVLFQTDGRREQRGNS